MRSPLLVVVHALKIHMATPPLLTMVLYKNTLHVRKKCATVKLPRNTEGQSHIFQHAEDDYWQAVERFRLAAFFFLRPTLV